MDKINQVNIFKNSAVSQMGNIAFSDDTIQTKSFKDVVSDMMVELNEVTNKPQELAREAMLGNADIHDVMSAISQSELTVQAATTITGKILQTYEKIMQIQI